MTMIEDFLLPDLVAELPAAIRLERLVQVLRETFICGAVVLLQREETEADGEQHDVEDEQRYGVLFPVLGLARDAAADELETAGLATGETVVGLRRVHGPFKVAAEWPRQERGAAYELSDKKEGVHRSK